MRSLFTGGNRLLVFLLFGSPIFAGTILNLTSYTQCTAEGETVTVLQGSFQGAGNSCDLTNTVPGKVTTVASAMAEVSPEDKVINKSFLGNSDFVSISTSTTPTIMGPAAASYTASSQSSQLYSPAERFQTKLIPVFFKLHFSGFNEPLPGNASTLLSYDIINGDINYQGSCTSPSNCGSAFNSIFDSLIPLENRDVYDGFVGISLDLESTLKSDPSHPVLATSEQASISIQYFLADGITPVAGLATPEPRSLGMFMLSLPLFLLAASRRWLLKLRSNS